MISEKEDEFELIKKFLSGDESAFNRIAIKYREKIYWHARRMTGNHLDADEIVQEVLITMYKQLINFKFQSGLYTWIYRITSTRSLNLIKRRKIRSFFSLEDNKETAIYDNDIINDLDMKERHNKLESILQKLPVKQREVFILRNYDELSYEEISKITGKSTGGLKANYFHAFKKVVELMNEAEDDG